MQRGPLSVPIDQCHGTSEYHTHLGRVSDVTREGRAKLYGRRSERRSVSPIAFDELVGTGRTISLWHLDVEGAEVPVLRSARRLFAEQRIKRVALEFIPFRWPAQNVSSFRAYLELAALFRGWRCED
eukprot:6767217-Prymnesium_polylepis.1